MSDINLNLKRQLKNLNSYLNSNSKDYISSNGNSGSGSVGSANIGVQYDSVLNDQHYYYYYYENSAAAAGTYVIDSTSSGSYTPVASSMNATVSTTPTITTTTSAKQQTKAKKDYQANLNKRYKAEYSIYKQLLKLNIRRENIEHALAATACKSQLEAINWLLSHSNDSTVTPNVVSTRDYILLLCPVRSLCDEISTFLKNSKSKCGPNDAHYNNMLPFMKLTSFFKLNDADILNLHRIFDYVFKYKNLDNFKLSSSSLIMRSSSDSSVASSSSSFSSSTASSLDVDEPLESHNSLSEINIDLHASSQMILLYPDIGSENSIKEMVSEFTKLISTLQQKSPKSHQPIVPYSKQLHLTLAYQFEKEHKRTLEDLAQKYIKYKDAGEWEIRLYSRDSRLDGRHTYKVTHPFKSQSDNAALCKPGDYIYVDSTRSSSKDSSKMSGTSHITGDNLVLSGKNVERAPETDTWQLHRSHGLVHHGPLNDIPLNRLSKQQENETKMRKRQSSSRLTTPGELKFVIMRHGERVDLVFGPQWLDTSFDHYGNYRRTNMNMPHQVPQRASKRDFNGDSPITEIGKIQAKFTGDALKSDTFTFQYCYTSPSLRSVQTAHHVLEAMGAEKTCKIRIEPSLFEFLGWYEKGVPSFLHPEALLSFGYNIDLSYKPLMAADKLQSDENYTDYYLRSFNLVKTLTNMHQREGANILMVGHAATLEVCTRQISGQQIRSYADFNATIRKVPYLGCCMLQKTNEAGFDIVPTNIPPLTHGATFSFDPMSLKM